MVTSHLFDYAMSLLYKRENHGELMTCRRLLVFFLIVYSIQLFFLDALPFLDFPNHLARACIISDLIFQRGTYFGDMYSFNFQFVPYILGDILMASTGAIFNPITNGRLWIVISFLIIPLGAMFFFKQIEDRIVKSDELLLLTLYLSTNWFFFLGFFNYQLGFGLTLITLGVFEMWMRCKSLASYLLYILFCCAVYLMHLASFVALGLIVGVVTLFRIINRRISYTYLMLAYLPIAMLSIFFLYSQTSLPNSNKSPLASLVFRSMTKKIATFSSPFIRFNYILDSLLFIGFVVALIVLVWPYRGKFIAQIRKSSSAVEYFLITAVLLVAYLLLPAAYQKISDVDNRMLLFFYLFLSLSIFNTIEPRTGLEKWERLSLRCFVFFLTINWVIISATLFPQNIETKKYIALLTSLPQGMTILPISTRQNIGRVRPFMHTGALYTGIRYGYTPYIFSGDKNDSMTYFNSLKSFYSPNIFWYIRNNDIPNWDKVRETYDFVVVTKPFDVARVNFDGYQLWKENTVAAAYVRKGVNLKN